MVDSCKFHFEFPPTTHPVVRKSTPAEEIQENLAIDVIHIHENCFLHCIDRVPGWSVVGFVNGRMLSEQVRVFKRVQLPRHGIPRSIASDCKYIKGEL